MSNIILAKLLRDKLQRNTSIATENHFSVTDTPNLVESKPQLVTINMLNRIIFIIFKLSKLRGSDFWATKGLKLQIFSIFKLDLGNLFLWICQSGSYKKLAFLSLNFENKRKFRQCNSSFLCLLVSPRMLDSSIISSNNMTRPVRPYLNPVLLRPCYQQLVVNLPPDFICKRNNLKVVQNNNLKWKVGVRERSG